ncbi:hypothetical protein WA026_006008 [Henosepilachna vigintioctopunctata]|uniref:Elongation of very long chain fatty acids protein n=1 Tax=Henosepilachna vigintioctopunctata TaxID=420089 RepID=A0AAW1U5S3_9CUCU
MIFSYVDNFIERYADPRTNNYLIGRSILYPISILFVYLLFVYKIGPWFMKDKKPYNCRNWIIAFDILQIFLNFYIAIKAIKAYFSIPGTFFCLELDGSNSPAALNVLSLAYGYHVLKLSDMIDTVFFILKASYRQANYLHIYHHTIMIFFSWYALKFVPGGQGAYIGITNCIVHVLMYSYYLLSTINPKYRNNISLKKSITTIQLVQFVFLGIMFTSSMRPSCKFPKSMSMICIVQSTYFCYLFGKFYYENYIKVKPGKKH